RIGVRERVQRDAPLALGGVVAELVRHEGVAELVNADRCDQNDHTDQDPLNLLRVHPAVYFPAGLWPRWDMAASVYLLARSDVSPSNRLHGSPVVRRRGGRYVPRPLQGRTWFG